MIIPYGRQSIDADDMQAVMDVMAADLLTGGPEVERFETALARTTGAPHAVACANGTAALHLALLALGIGPGDAVIVPSVTFLASANAARFVGADVRFADVHPETGLLTQRSTEHALRSNGPGIAKAIIPVHLNGQSVDMGSMRVIASENGLHVVEDACHALGGRQTIGNALHPVGACAASDLACFSFHPVKNIAMGEGGAVTTGDRALAERLRRLRNHGMLRDAGSFLALEDALDPEDGDPNPWYYEMPEPGFNYRLSDIQCALGTSQLGKLERFLAQRRRLAAHYARLLAPLAPDVTPIPRALAHDGLHLYPVLIDFAGLGMTRATAMKALRSKGIGSQVHYIPVHRQPYYRRLYPELRLPGADRYYARCLSLPLFPSLEHAQVEAIVAALRHVLDLD